MDWQKMPDQQSLTFGTYAQKPGFFARIGDEPEGYFQKPGFSPTFPKS
jgi:hypothetical protein